MIGKKITWMAFFLIILFIGLSIFFRINERYTLSNTVLASSILIFLIFSAIQRKIKEDMLVFVPEDIKEREWRYYFSSLLAFIFLFFTTLLNIFIVFFNLSISRVMIDLLIGIVLLLMLYTVFSIPSVEKRGSFYILFIIAIIFSLAVLASQLDIYHLPAGASPFLKKMGDPLFMINLAIIFWMASLISGGELPSPLSSIIGIHEKGRAVREEIGFRRNILYAIIVAFISIFIVANVLAVFGLPRFNLGYIPWQYAIIFSSIGILVALIFYILFILPEKSAKIKEKYDVRTLYRIVILATSASIAAFFIIIAIMLQLNMMNRLGPINLSQSNFIDFAIFAILVLVGPYGFYEYSIYRRVNLMEERFPEFLRDLAESRKAGLTMAKAVENAAKGDYGYLTPEIKKMAVQISWGVPFSEALRRFGERIGTPLVVRTTTMVVKASETGGKIADVIEAAAKNVREIKILQAERRTEMQMYLMIIYVSFFVFLAVIAILSGMFLPKLVKAGESIGGAGVGGISVGGVDMKTLRFIYVCTALSQAIGNGIVAGALSEGKMVAGLRHAAIMILFTYLAFRLLF